MLDDREVRSYAIIPSHQLFGPTSDSPFYMKSSSSGCKRAELKKEKERESWHAHIKVCTSSIVVLPWTSQLFETGLHQASYSHYACNKDIQDMVE